MPADMAPMMVPIRAMATVRPSCRGVRPNLSVRECVVPAMTAVSNPNKSPPKAPTAVAFNSVEFNFIYLPACGLLTRVKATIKRRDCCRENASNAALSGVRLSSGQHDACCGAAMVTGDTTYRIRLQKPNNRSREIMQYQAAH